MTELFRDTPLPAATRAVPEGRVVDADTGEVFRWVPEPMVLPLTERLRRRMEKEQGETVQEIRYRLNPTIVEFKDGKVTVSTSFWDNAYILQQLGAIPLSFSNQEVALTDHCQ